VHLDDQPVGAGRDRRARRRGSPARCAGLPRLSSLTSVALHARVGHQRGQVEVEGCTVAPIPEAAERIASELALTCRSRHQVEPPSVSAPSESRPDARSADTFDIQELRGKAQPTSARAPGAYRGLPANLHRPVPDTGSPRAVGAAATTRSRHARRRGRKRSLS
jgi:hypothetical protein